MKVRVLVFAGLSACASPLFACVACGSPAAHHLRHALFSGDFARVLLAVAAPFPVLLGAAAGLSRCFGSARGDA